MTLSIRLDQEISEQLAQTTALNHPDWLAPVIHDNLSAIDKMKPLSRKNEHWKYNETSFLKDAVWQVARAENQTDGARSQLKIDNAIELHFTAGQLQEPAQIERTSGLTISTFDNLTASQQAKILHAYQTEQKSPNKLAAIATMLVRNAVYIELDATFEGTLVLNHSMNVSQAATSHQLATSLIYIDAAEGCNATIIEQYETQENPQADADNLYLKRSWIDCGANAKIRYYALTLASLNYRLIDTLDLLLSRDSQLDAFCFSPGGLLSRHDINIRHRETGSEAKLNGVYLPRQTQSIDYHTNVEHQAPHCTTHETFRGIIDGEASATFNGKIHIFPNAQKSDAFLSNKNLLLTNRAQVNTKPELEIYADDVRCAHGATVAQLDDKATYFLQTRGINKANAQKMLSVAFVKALVRDITFEPVRELLSSIIEQRLT